MKKFIVGLALALVGINASADWDGIVTGKISKIDVAVQNGDNAGFRIRLEGSSKPCGNDNDWAYVNKSDDNYQTTVSVLLAAHMAGKEITIYSNKNTSWQNYCQLGYVVVR